MRKIAWLCFPALVLLIFGLNPLQAEITRNNIRYVEYPDFPEAHSTWGSIGYNRKYDKVYIGVTNHRDKVGLFEYDIAGQKMRLCGFLPDLAHLRDYQWQGKVHSQLVEGPDGNMYFTTDGGESREEFLMNHPHGYGGGFFFRWEPAAERLVNLGNGLRYESIKDLAVDQLSGKILGISYPQVHLLLYDPLKNELRDLGRVGSDHVPRVLFSDWFGNMYYDDWRQRLIKYEHETGRLLFSKDSLPAFEATPGYRVVTGITGYAADRVGGVIYLVTYSSKLLAFYPTRLGIGKVEDLGGIFEGPDVAPYDYYCPNLALGDNGMLYYFIGGHGSYVGGKEQNVLVEFNPQTRSKQVVLSFPLKEINEVTGANVKDSQGNLYFCGRRSDPQAERMGESGASRPFMIIFNPGREIN
ncbi:MAG: hypothetical protein A3F83_05165 [Candidatus Glassbacteria bacterium RIFCSPLOWO2_12_FULL_58_11]|uniref:Glucose/Sorbosone dehydrogenase domain-containing protein n=2 Tax=Candidatus Glassiibacteriota TaxID=1817805 RepID=A0A1F5Z196_9BACT|nr:MAG: hypothetical protein A2Z86_00645 [Candidatus Glassbacteria bacterium GWA2_58_10]OGG05957.1 MAG: hypothetical protein A3F83_05165 [Candidatus Glassbacteria bacterium RIFCSPLOWO2_12_FULL_58_11]